MAGDVAIIVAIIGAVVTLISSYLSKMSQIKFEQMKLKQEFYMKYIKAFSDSVNNPIDNNYVVAENHAFNDLNLIAGAKALKAIYDFRDVIINHLKYNNIENYDVKYSQLFTSMIKEIRLDLHGYKNANEGIENFYMLSGVINKGKP